MPFNKSTLFDFLSVLNEDLTKKITLVAAGGTAMTRPKTLNHRYRLQKIPSCDIIEFEQPLKSNPPGYKVD